MGSLFRSDPPFTGGGAASELRIFDVPSVRYSNSTYSCAKSPETGRIIVGRMDRHLHYKGDYALDEDAAYAWLGGHGLRRGKIKSLLNQVFRPGQ